MESTNTKTPLSALIETIVDKRAMNLSEQAEVNKLAAETKTKGQDLAALAKLTDLITKGEIAIS